MRTNRLLKNLLILSIVLLSYSGLYSQAIIGSMIREEAEIWTPLVNPTVSQTGNDFRLAIQMPFSFVYDNQNISWIYAFDNGYISLNIDRSPLANDIPSFPNTTNIISWYKRDLYTSGSLSYKVEGTQPFRVLTVQQLGARLLNDFSGNSFDVQIKFYETTNEVKIIYNNVNGFGFSELDGFLYFIGSSSANYINIKPNAPTQASTFYYGNSNPNVQPQLSENVIKYFYRGRSFTLTSTPKLFGVNPANNAVLSTGQIYSGENGPFVRVSRAEGNKDITIRYTISGPLPSNNVIYTALNTPDINGSNKVIPQPQPIGTGIRVLMPYAKGIAGRLTDGALDLTNVQSGEYRVDAYLEYLDGTPYSVYATSRFTVAFPADLAIINILEPIYNPGSIYQFSGAGIPVKILVKNQGAEPVDYVKATAKIYKEDGSLDGTMVEEFDLSDSPILFNETRELTFSNLYKSSTVGMFNISAEVNLRNLMADKYMANNIYPRTGDPKKNFEVAYQVEAQVLSMLSPANQVYNNRPIRVAARFRNNGVSDISNSIARFEIFYEGNKVYDETTALKDLPAGVVRESDLIWTVPFIPQKVGGYNAIITVYVDLDEVPANNSINVPFSVIPGMSGTYSISKSGGNFLTIADAVKALYERGVDAPVTFLLKDPIYVEGNLSLNTPAIDFSSSIIGLDNPKNTVTFTIDPQFATRNTVNVYCYSATGIGVYFGQSSFPANNAAPVLNVTTNMVKKYANAPKNIIFDGGVKKSLKFTVGTNNNFRAVFYLGNGASNIQIKNLLIEDGILQAVSNNCRLPLSSYNSLFNRFEFEDDNSNFGTYSAGIVLRSKSPLNPILGVNNFYLDTLANSNNIISGNEIQKFSYGIVSLGIGNLLKFGPQKFVKYFNTNNSFDDNLLYNLSKSGIFLGYELNSEVFKNRIFGIQGGCGNYTAGIAAGGESKNNKFGYHNIGLFISSNEISNIKGAEQEAYGISIVQARNDFSNLEINYSFPDQPENLRIVNNMIWGFETTNPNAHINGIMLATERQSTNNFDWKNMNFAPKYSNYYSRNDVIANNTIIMGDDGVKNDGAVVGISLFNTKGAKLFNNAIDIKDPSISSNNPVTSTVFYYGLHPNKGGLTSNRNAYYLETDGASIYRFIETDIQGRIVEQGHRNEFASLTQWQNWTGQDWYSVYGDFYSDHKFYGFPPFTLRIKNDPVPMGSILNNRGYKLEDNNVDIDGKMRGEAGENYDIGAVEFRGRTNGRDGEVVAITSPGAYKATTPLPFSESEYIMTTAPVAVKAIVRNNGQLPITNQNATLKFYRQSPSGAYIQEGPNVNIEMQEIFYSEDKEIDFLTADGISNSTNYEWFPKTYGELRKDGYVVPEQFKTMEANVTPLYKIEVTVPSDELNKNNKVEKLVRFYIRKSPIQLLVSAENIKTSPLTTGDPLDIIAGNLNLDSLKASFYRLGWYINLDLEDPRIDIDIFDRRKWEPRSINYPIYRTLFWVDGHDFDATLAPKRLTRYDRDQISNFLEAGTIVNKKNLFVSSQEIVKNETGEFSDWLRDNLSTKLHNFPNPMGVNGNYNGKYVSGVIIGRDNEFEVRSTAFPGDDYPRVAINAINNPGKGITRIGMKYKTHINDDVENNFFVKDAERIALLATTYIRYNTILSGVEWRHWANLDGVLRGTLDFFEYSGGNAIPVELLSFDAKQAGNRVDLNWVTASEINTSKFQVERANVNETGKNFLTIDEVPAAGNSNITSYYGPIVDSKVEMGKSYIYRLKMLDKDGDFKYSDEKLVTLTSLNGTISLEEAKPNPARDITNIEFTLGNDMEARVSLFDINGKEIEVISNGKLVKGTHKFELNLTNIPSGSYTVVLKASDVLLTTKLNVVK